MIGTEGGCFGDVTVIVLGLTFLRELEVRAEFVVDSGKMLLEISGGRDVDRDR